MPRSFGNRDAAEAATITEQERDRRREEEERARRAEQRSVEAEASAASKTFPRLRLQVNKVTTKHVYCGEFQSDNAGTNWACTGQVVYSVDWFRGVFGEPRERRRLEFEVVGIHEVTS